MVEVQDYQGCGDDVADALGIEADVGQGFVGGFE